MSILNYSAFCFCLWIYSKTRKKSCRMSNVRFKEHAHAPRTRFNILTSEQLFPLFQHSWASFPPLPRPAPSQHDEYEDLQTMMRRMVWMQHVAYMSTFFIEQIEPKFIVPTWWMSVNSTFSPLRIFIKEIYAYLFEHIISSCRFFTVTDIFGND